MAWYKVKHKTTGEVQFVETGIADFQASPDWTVQTFAAEPTEGDSAEAGFDTPAKAELYALEMIEVEADQKTGDAVSRLRRQLSIDRTWNEIQRLKLAQATNNIPADLTDRRKMFPTLMALAALTGNTLAAVATSLESRLWDRVKRMALIEARLLQGHDAVRAATTVEQKIQAAKNADWSDV